MDRRPISSRREHGVAAVEFALISFVFFTLILGIMELGRLLYLWNTVQEVTRHAAREAVVRNFSSAEQAAVLRQAMFSFGSVGTVYLPAGPEIGFRAFDDAEVRITYLSDPTTEVNPMPPGPKENLSACAGATAAYGCIRYVRAEVCTASGCGNVPYQPMVSFLLVAAGVDFAVSIPVSPVVMPAESLGFDPSL